MLASGNCWIGPIFAVESRPVSLRSAFNLYLAFILKVLIRSAVFGTPLLLAAILHLPYCLWFTINSN